jgi:phosphatidylserine decarboxylase
MNQTMHQYIDRETGEVKTEKLFQDRLIEMIYGTARERMPVLFNALTSARTSQLLGFVNYDCLVGTRLTGAERFVNKMGIDLSECLRPIEQLKTPREIFERKIRFWETRPMPTDPAAVVSPADARILVGSFAETRGLFLKEKFFSAEELLGGGRSHWPGVFEAADFAVLRLTPEKYHYNHAPVSGRVADVYELEGRYHSCNPGAVIRLAGAYAKNRRAVTVIDTDLENGTGVGLVAMVEIAALMIGDIQSCYSERRYDQPRPLAKGMWIEKGQPKSLFLPGSSVDVLMFQPRRIAFSPDIVANLHHPGAVSRFAQHFGRSLVETDVKVRSEIARRINVSASTG